MTFDPLAGSRYREHAVTSGDWREEHRARVAHEEVVRLERRQQDLLEQVSERNTPAERIRIWERRHGLTLPRDSNHRLLRIVAAETELALDQVTEEQQRRLAAARPEPAAAPSAV
ncbi:MAG TPA: hypothetical protein VLX90_03745 [Steroidobacteraceae bacterium]|nr:hypothetical protein [Steroidobacteraceae bacterium]